MTPPPVSEKAKVEERHIEKVMSLNRRGVKCSVVAQELSDFERAAFDAGRASLKEEVLAEIERTNQARDLDFYSQAALIDELKRRVEGL